MLKAQSEVKQKHISASSLAFDALIKPWEITLLDPAILFSTIYSGLTYCIFYSFLEAFPIAYMDTYGFNTGEAGLAFLAGVVGQIIFVPSYMAYMYFKVDPRITRDGLGPPEYRLIPALYASISLPVGLLIFGKSLILFSRRRHSDISNSLDRSPRHSL
jgi:DHA1 family multidrug resistance protein-like MFS transporter